MRLIKITALVIALALLAAVPMVQAASVLTQTTG